MIVKRKLGNKAFKYMYESLDEGKTLAFLLKEIDLTKGKVLTFLPSTTEPNKILDFKHGGKLPLPKNSPIKYGQDQKGNKLKIIKHINLNDILIKEVQKNLITNNDFCIFEEPVSQASDKCMRNSKIPWLFYNEEVYYLVNKSVPEETLNATINTATSSYPPLIGAIYKNDTDFALSSKTITKKALYQIAQSTFLIFIGAYDAESFLVWKRKSERGERTSRENGAATSEGHVELNILFFKILLISTNIFVTFF